MGVFDAEPLRAGAQGAPEQHHQVGCVWSASCNPNLKAPPGFKL